MLIQSHVDSCKHNTPYAFRETFELSCFAAGLALPATTTFTML